MKSFLFHVFISLHVSACSLHFMHHKNIIINYWYLWIYLLTDSFFVYTFFNKLIDRTNTAINHYYNITAFKHIPLVSPFQDLWVHIHNYRFTFSMGQTVEEPGEHLRSGRVNRTEVKYCTIKHWTSPPQLNHNCPLFRVSDWKNNNNLLQLH